MVTIDKVVLIHPAKLDIRLPRFDAAYPSCLPKYEIPYALTGDEVDPPKIWKASKNAYALLENVKEIVNNIDSNTLVLEDDCRFSKDFNYMLPKFLAEIPDDWDLAYLGCKHIHEKLYKPIRVTEHCLQIRCVVMNQAVLYNPASKDKLLPLLDVNNWNGEFREYDQAYGFNILRSKLKAYSPIKNICAQLSETSTLRNLKALPHPKFFNDFDYIDLDHSIKHMREDTIIE